MITLHCYPGYEDSRTVLEHLLYSVRLSCITPLEILPLLVAENLLRCPASEEVLRQLSDGTQQMDSDPCYLVNRYGDRRLLFCFNSGLQAAMAVAAVASMPRDAAPLQRLRQYKPLLTSFPGNLCLEMTPELCDAEIWRILTRLDLPIDLAADVHTLEQLQNRLASTPPKDGQEPPYRLMQEGRRYPRLVLTHQDTTGWDKDPQVTHQDTLGWSGTVLRTGGDGSDLIGFRWQDPHSWYDWDLIPALYRLPVPRTAPAFSGLSDRYEIRDQMNLQDCLDLLESGQTLYLMILDRDKGGRWRAEERLLENCDSYYDLFDAAMEGADAPARWVLAVDLDRPPLCVQELPRCSVLFSFHLYQNTVTLADGPEALRRFLRVLEVYERDYRAPAQPTQDAASSKED